MFKKQQAAPVVPLTTAQEVSRYRSMAISEFNRSAKAGRLEAQAVHASRASALAALALSYQLQLAAEGGDNAESAPIQPHEEAESGR